MKTYNKKVLLGMFLLGFAFLLHFIPALADNGGGVVPGASTAAPTNPWQIFTAFIIPAFKLVGIVMVIFGAIEMGFAFRSDEAEAKRKGLMVAMSGAILCSICMGMEAISKIENPADKTQIIIDKIGNEPMSTMINQLGSWLPYFGYIAMFWGFFELAKATRSDDAGGKQKALTIIVSGVALWAIIPAMTWVLWGV